MSNQSETAANQDEQKSKKPAGKVSLIEDLVKFVFILKILPSNNNVYPHGSQLSLQIQHYRCFLSSVYCSFQLVLFSWLLLNVYKMLFFAHRNCIIVWFYWRYWNLISIIRMRIVRAPQCPVQHALIFYAAQILLALRVNVI